MLLRSVLFAGLAIAGLAGCASGPSMTDRARAACADEGHQPGPAMDRCITETAEALRRAQEQPQAPPPRPPGSRGA